MAEQRHIINQQRVEIHLPDDAQVHTVQQAVSRLCRERFAPVIERLCNRHSPVGTGCKIDKISLHLGTLPVQDLHKLETVLAEKFGQALAGYPVVSTQTNTLSTTGTRQASPVQLLTHYLTTGTLPWWADISSQRHLHQLFETLLRAPSPAFTTLLIQIGSHPQGLKRLVYTCTDQQLLRATRLFTHLPTDYLPALQKELTARIHRHARQVKPDLTTQQITRAFWTAAWKPVSTGAEPAAITTQILHQMGQAMGPSFKAWLLQMGPQALPKNIRAFHQRYHNLLRDTQKQLTQLAQCHPDIALWQTTFQHLQQRLSQSLSVQTLQQLKKLLEDVYVAQQKHTDKNTRHAIPPPVIEALLQPLKQYTSLQHSVQPLPLQTVEEDTDFLSIPHGGLVILWPFLPRFFENLGLLTNKDFKDETAAYKAVALLQYLVAPEETAFEPFLALQKILCAIPLETPLPLESLTTTEQQMADALLQAVMARGPHWKNLSPNGFRTSYLQREALLRSRDGHWLLQVKKETHDITLEKLPWSFTTIKLPWMKDIIIVEWM